MQQLSGQDAMFLYGEMENSPMHIGPVLIYDPSSAPGGSVRFKDILKTFENRLDRTPLFTRKLVNVPLGLDHPFWVDDDQVDVEFHVRHIALPHPGDWRQFCIQIARLHSRPLDRARPLWEAYVIEGLDKIEGLPRGCFAVFLKVHHAAMDGATGVEVMNVLHDLEPLAVQEARPRARRHMEMPPGEAEILRRIAGSLLKQPLSLSQMIGRSVPAWRRVQRGKSEKKFHSLVEKEKTRFNDRISPHRVFGALNMDFADVAAIRSSVESVTVNDVMLTIVSGALRRYLGET